MPILYSRKKNSIKKNNINKDSGHSMKRVKKTLNGGAPKFFNKMRKAATKIFSKKKEKPQNTQVHQPRVTRHDKPSPLNQQVYTTSTYSPKIQTNIPPIYVNMSGTQDVQSHKPTEKVYTPYTPKHKYDDMSGVQSHKPTEKVYTPYTPTHIYYDNLSGLSTKPSTRQLRNLSAMVAQTQKARNHKDPPLYENVFKTAQTTEPLYENLNLPDPVYQNFNQIRTNSGQQITYTPKIQTNIPPIYVNMSGKQDVQSTKPTEPLYDVADRGNIKAKNVNLSGLSPKPPTRPLSAMVAQTQKTRNHIAFEERHTELKRSTTELQNITNLLSAELLQKKNSALRSAELLNKKNTYVTPANVPSPRETVLQARATFLINRLELLKTKLDTSEMKKAQLEIQKTENNKQQTQQTKQKNKFVFPVNPFTETTM